ncbi:hypothetical protein KKG31_00175 [Patescibacteria group bacterium]|nr:hypothetical protein [Patescibacteria group bacterium]MBU1757607.1 hypothetical protein [Patescibacteria group bacterium]
MLAGLRDGLADKSITNANVVQVSDYLENNEVDITEDQTKRLNVVFEKLSNSAVVAAQ